MLDLGLLNEETIAKILSLYNQYRLAVLENKNSEAIIDAINQLFIEHYAENKKPKNSFTMLEMA